MVLVEQETGAAGAGLGLPPPIAWAGADVIKSAPPKNVAVSNFAATCENGWGVECISITFRFIV